MKRWTIALICAASGLAATLPSFAAPSADEILNRLDSNLSFTSMRYSGRMEITARGQTRVKTMDAVAKGSDKAFIEFTNPEDRGVRYLKLGKNLWMYFPKDQETVPISGHLLKNGMMGSDLSYEDALESRDLKERYSAAIKGEEGVDGRPCVIVELSATSPNAPYSRLLLWVDSERWVALKEQMFAKSGKLLKTSATLEVRRLGDRWFPVRSELASALVKGSRTLFVMDKVEMNPVLDGSQFTMAALKK